MQHARYSIETTATICAAALGITPLVRVPNHDPQWISPVLDGGAQGVIVPDVNTSAQQKAIVTTCRFPPLRKRSVMGQGRALGYRDAAIRAEPHAQRGDRSHRDAGDHRGYRELQGDRRGRWDRCPVDRLR
jgi:2-keto-3-deoxy-L-rhamnonate aldolase RhmA